MPFLARPIVAAKIAVAAPITAITARAVGDFTTTAEQRAVR
jgi:hypothetical protein